ncbi:MAG: hypothetical protein ACD_16C00081G0004 [uncultured bacterium]|nr:MAG: hypothetical protein ACD_16C00081G0004 [uncultured bacterium]
MSFWRPRGTTAHIFLIYQLARRLKTLMIPAALGLSRTISFP